MRRNDQIPMKTTFQAKAESTESEQLADEGSKGLRESLGHLTEDIMPCEADVGGQADTPFVAQKNQAMSRMRAQQPKTAKMKNKFASHGKGS